MFVFGSNFVPTLSSYSIVSPASVAVVLTPVRNFTSSGVTSRPYLLPLGSVPRHFISSASVSVTLAVENSISSVMPTSAMACPTGLSSSLKG